MSNNEYTWTEEDAPLVLDGGLPVYDTRTPDEKTNERIDALLAELDELRGRISQLETFVNVNRVRLVAVETWQQLSRGD